ncbi:MAG: hypothetical protein QM756_36455 [Polyangiaceae bacterium]
MAALSRFGSLRPSFTVALCCALTLAFQRTALAQSSDDAVLDGAADVMSNEYANKHFTSARKKLESLLKKLRQKGLF